MILNGKVSAFFLIMCNLARPHHIFFAQLTFCHHCMDAFCTSSFDSPHSDTKKCTHEPHPQNRPLEGGADDCSDLSPQTVI